MGADTTVGTVHFTTEEDKWTSGDLSVYVSVGDNPNVKLNPRCPGLVITAPGWYNCTPALKGQYFGFVQTTDRDLWISELQAYPLKYVTHEATTATSSPINFGKEPTNVIKYGPQSL